MFILEYIKHPRDVGAIIPSGKHLSDKMIRDINFKKAKCIVELGPGTGVFTQNIVSRITDETLLILIEINKNFYNILKDRYADKKNIIVVNDSAENIDIIIENNHIKKVDYIVSGLPFTSLPKEISKNILSKVSNILEDESSFITFQYSLFKLNFFKEFFVNISYDRVMQNLPPAYVLKCKGRRYEERYISSR